jgi:hypothetical protein
MMLDLTSEDVARAAAELGPDALSDWLVASIREAVDPLLSMSDDALRRVSEGGSPPTRFSWLTPPMARLQLRLRTILIEAER